MKKQIGLLIATAAISITSFANTFVNMQTSQGNIEIELYDQQAPITTQNFLNYVKSGFYQGTTFHRVIPNFMIQGGGFDKNLQEKKTAAPIKNEASNGVKNTRGTIAMARTNDPNSATSQFFINTVDNQPLNQSTYDAGYTVFGKVVKGLDIVDKISNVNTTTKGIYQNVPTNPIQIERVQIIGKNTSK
ncbi:peptidylprolyl isomerase [Acinetobacter sp. HY1485]|uniref:peptidylprolyl isomerase n=1 Tax=Acinetobacter sp. HY1485 TaxID=2970918 RepID=UPI0022B9BA1A|nr:peptidylprolyl isomerase [Acinetobacter sp. HY1485]